MTCAYCGCQSDALDCKCAHPTLAAYLAHDAWRDRIEASIPPVEVARA